MVRELSREPAMFQIGLWGEVVMNCNFFLTYLSFLGFLKRVSGSKNSHFRVLKKREGVPELGTKPFKGSKAH